ncbi:alpha/beta fold hydrolase [Nanchangia anserum]|uniref:Alpha/beta fold hydrolase n=1 Tax=Nanchangia anserum TaxID=2692125 RepID=A0A8I0GDA6_9ACTO|nr:alpha/beta fold hydrolase [Nanchangia anserum]MBD3690151.1 alpha/beta fold hydrolase [Nanchangia anserum]QOX82070.1 alpha/beta fold hydrolase [Nanchangia anserum]
MRILTRTADAPRGLLVCVSGLGCGADQWAHLLAHMDGWVSVAYDRAALSQRHIDIDQSAEELNRLIGAARRRYPHLPLTVVAHSWGAMIVQAWASTSERDYTHLVLVDPSFSGNSEGRSRLLQWLERAYYRLLNPAGARELPAFYRAWADARLRPRPLPGRVTIIAARRSYVHELSTLATNFRAHLVCSTERRHNLPRADPQSIAEAIAAPPL